MADSHTRCNISMHFEFEWLQNLNLSLHFLLMQHLLKLLVWNTGKTASTAPAGWLEWQKVFSIITNEDKGTFLHSAVSSNWDCSKHFTLHPLADLFFRTPTRLLWEPFSYAAITAQRLFVHISTSVYSQVLIHTAERTGATWTERIAQ